VLGITDERGTYLKCSEVYGLLTDVVSRQGSDEVVDGNAHDLEDGG